MQNMWVHCRIFWKNLFCDPCCHYHVHQHPIHSWLYKYRSSSRLSELSWLPGGHRCQDRARHAHRDARHCGDHQPCHSPPHSVTCSVTLSVTVTSTSCPVTLSPRVLCCVSPRAVSLWLGWQRNCSSPDLRALYSVESSESPCAGTACTEKAISVKLSWLSWLSGNPVWSWIMWELSQRTMLQLSS